MKDDEIRKMLAQHKEDDARIRQAAEDWNRTFDAIEDFIFIIDIHNTVIRVNKALLNLLKVKKEDIVGKKCYEVLHAMTKPWPNCPFEKTKIDKKVHTEEVDDPHVGIPLLITTSPIFNDKNEMTGVVHTAKDISEIKRTQNELIASNKELLRLDQLKSDFVSTVSHELRTPLSIIKEGVALVLDRITGDVNEKQKKILTTAKDNIDRLARIIDALLDMSRIESGMVELKKGMIELTALIRKVASSFESAVKNKGLKLELDVPGKEVMCNADNDKLIQVFTNLVGNAVKFTEKGCIKISCADKGSEVECAVSDTGVGIADENIPKVFSKFQQFGRLPGPGEKGTGLGLSIAKGIIDLHGGRIWVDSKLNKGTTFIFTLPKEI